MFTTVAYCELPKITEEAFLKREFGIDTVYIRSINHFLSIIEKSNNNIITIVSTNPQFWISVLNKFKKNTVIFILIGNETYEPQVFNSLNDLRSLCHAFVYNLPTVVKSKNIIGPIIGNIFDGGLGKTLSEGSVYRDARISYSLKNKFKKVKINYSASRLPQGYSNNFASKISNKINISSNVSLLSNSLTDLIVAERKDLYDFVFIGQSTNRRREIFLKNIEKLPRSVVIYNNEFKGIYEDSDSTYLNQLLCAKFILIPPGFYNNSNHRYTESLICHSLPVILSNNSLDPSDNYNWTNELSYINRYSIKAQVKKLSSFDDITYKKFYEFAKSVDFEKIQQVKKLISSILG